MFGLGKGEKPRSDPDARDRRRLPDEESPAGDPQLRERVVEALKRVHDPEIPVNIYDLGLIYRIDVDEKGEVDIDMTLTAPACPVAGTMPGLVAEAVKTVEGVTDARVTLVWDPPWTQERMTEEAMLQLGLL
ncbi:MAG: SUF system Fe-S cluster assembly protein [Chromatiales bacterium]|jgi:FeS assembly SUF system protein